MWSSARIELLSRCGTWPTPGMCGTEARPPTLMKMRGADSTSSPTRSCVGDSKAACPRSTVQPGRVRKPFSTPSREAATTAWARALTRAMSTLTVPSITTP